MEEGRLVLFCDIKCGFDDLFITEKNVAINVDFLTDTRYYEDLLKTLNLDKKLKVSNVPTREELIEKYKADPLKLLHDKGVYSLLKDHISEVIATGYLYGIDLECEKNKNYPELFEMSNAVLKVISKEEFYKLDLQDFIFEAEEEDELLNEFENAILEESKEVKKPTDTSDFKVENNEKIWKA